MAPRHVARVCMARRKSCQATMRNGTPSLKSLRDWRGSESEKHRRKLREVALLVAADGLAESGEECGDGVVVEGVEEAGAGDGLVHGVGRPEIELNWV